MDWYSLLSEIMKSHDVGDSSLTVQVTCKSDHIKCVCWYSVPCSRLLSESTKSQNERDSFLTVQVACKCDNTNYACAGIPYRAASCFLKVRKDKMSVTVSLPRRLFAT